MASKFTPSQAVDMSKEKDWSMNLGMLDWDNTSIVFTKRSLVEFLKYTGTTVDTGFSNIQKLPRYAKFGKLTSTEAELPETATSPTISSSEINRLLAEEFTDDALSTAPPPAATQPVQSSSPGSPDDFKPTRRVRTQPGGHDSIGNLFGSEPPQAQFIPTRKVRQRPGGEDNIEGLF
ncbi:uncharacterized protein F5891DRAFT_1016068 [Suillus fuscotomentosus]|uniref:Uncharacterized protein n=1 Tax=Suillus fuscotomentosus TaxID=1912939 RepID=A0AAD4HPN3_9AGAM|nr:uncharacterized protein F5891DRAFT_1016068 [Suillus fuscotomentosus]KAG1903971.1 hypothetical protein F5891DRAFT_1016068 [Suillus fuscotomentosus]